MHGDQLAVFIILVLLITAVASMAHTIVKGRQRLAEIRASAAARAEADPQIERLTDENGRLRGHVAKLESRLATLERIVTDPAERTAREIEALR
jgi:ubiquinone biosynthesis protein UbiJ